MSDDCKHPRIQTWRFKDSAEVAGLWSCTDCGTRFESLKVAQLATDAQISAAIAAERERCAKVCDDYAAKHGAKGDDDSKAQGWMMLQCAAAIRAGG